MDPMTFLSRRFETHLEGDLQIGDEVIDEYGDRAIILREPYYCGVNNPEKMTLIFYGKHMCSLSVNKVKKTGKSYAKELNTIFEGLKGIKYE